MTQDQTPLRYMTPDQWYRETQMSFGEVFDLLMFTPTLDGFTELTLSEIRLARRNGVVLNGAYLAPFLMQWWTRQQLIA